MGGLAAVVLVALAINEFNASASISKSVLASENPGSQASLDGANYPVRVDLGKEGPSDTVAYPVIISFQSAPVGKAGVEEWGGSVLLAMALQLPEQQFDMATRHDASRLAVLEERHTDRTETELDAAMHQVRDQPSMTGRSGSSLANVINVKYDLASQFSSAEGLAIRKPLFVNAASKGHVTLRIVQDSKIVVRLADLQRAFGEVRIAGLEKIKDHDGYVDFATLRDSGIAVQYDAAKDVVQMTTRPETG